MSEFPPQGPSSSGGRSTRTPNPAEITIMAGGGVALICSFLPFYTSSFSGLGSSSVSAWSSGLFPTATLITIFALAGAVPIALSVFGVKMPDKVLSFSTTQLVLIDGFFATVLAAAFLLQDHPGADLGVGYYFMFLGAIAVLVGGIMNMRNSAG